MRSQFAIEVPWVVPTSHRNGFIEYGRSTVKKMKHRKEFRRTADRIIRELLDLGIVTVEPSLKTTYINYKKDLDPSIALEVLTWYGKG